MVKRKLAIILLGLLVMLFGCGMVYGMVSVEVTNHFETGIVDISLTEYQKNGNIETLWVDNPVILPGSVISKIPRIHNDGNACYVRAKITFRETDDINEANLFGIGNKWIKADDGYYYYTEILPHGGDVDLFKGLTLPDDYSQENEGTQFYIDIDVDAIQSKHFTPLFDAAQPWGSVEILECGKEGQYDISKFKPSDSQAFKIEYQGKTGKLIKNSDDFFANFPYLMPGDTYSDTARLVNDGNEDITLYFRSTAQDASNLLDKIQLKITNEINGKTVVFYDGNLRATELSETVVLGTIKANTEADFNFEIKVPAELNNQYSISSSYVKWLFSTKMIDGSDSESPKTGDAANLNLYTGMFGLSLILFGILIIMSTKPKKKEETNG